MPEPHPFLGISHLQILVLLVRRILKKTGYHRTGIVASRYRIKYTLPFGGENSNPSRARKKEETT